MFNQYNDDSCSLETDHDYDHRHQSEVFRPKQPGEYCKLYEQQACR